MVISGVMLEDWHHNNGPLRAAPWLAVSPQVDRYIVKKGVSYTAENEDELSVQEGDHISVLHPAQATPRGYADMARLGGWLYAMNADGSEGLVPEGCIEVQEAVGD